VISELTNELLKENDFLKKELSKVKNNTDDVRNILIIGKTGSGKSTLANIITGTDKFREGKYTVSETHHIQAEKFSYEKVNYHVIDTVGIGDTQLTEKQVLDKISEATYSVRNGLHQILFVTSGRFDQGEINAYELPKKAIFDENVDKFITIVRTSFPNFEDEQECQKDILLMRKENKGLTEIINSCNKVIHVENYPMTANLSLRFYSEETRNSSRNILLKHLSTCQETYKPQNLQELVERIGNSVSIKEQLEQELVILKRQSQDISKENESDLTSRIRKLEKEIEQQKENIRQETKEHIMEKGVN